MKLDIIRAWKDRDYFDQLSDEQRALVPEHPIADVDLADEIMQQIFGGLGTEVDQPNTQELACVQSVLIYCLTTNCNGGVPDLRMLLQRHR